MPHIPADRREPCLDLRNCKDFGELHYFFGQQIQRDFLSAPCYNTLRNLRRFWVQTAPQQEYFRKVRQALRIPMADVLNEAALAWDEFYLSVGHVYEDYKASVNGHAYQKSLDAIKALGQPETK